MATQTELLAASTSAANSADFTQDSGAFSTVMLKSATILPNGGTAEVQIKSGTTYYTVATLDLSNPATVLCGPGTYRVAKTSGGIAFGVDRIA